ncbi:FMRFamide receptor [Lamellibrachia satsuma]|nr:FMRFamide receptor [Lamellibrachia satsuma]
MLPPDDNRTSAAATMDDRCRLFDLVVLTVVIGCLCLVGLAGNLTSLFVLRRHNAETVTVFLLECLAVSDALLLLCSLVVYCLAPILAYAGAPTALQDVCTSASVFVWPFAVIAHTATVWLTVLVTVTRYQTICSKTVKVASLQIGRTRLHVVGVIVFAVLYNLPRFFEHQPVSVSSPPELTSSSTNVTTAPSKERSTKPLNVGDSRVYQIVYSNILYFPVMYIVPLLLLTFLNYKLVSAVRVIRLRKRSLTGGQRHGSDHITSCVIMIVFVFICCQTPALINQIFWAATTPDGRSCGRFHYYYTRLSDALVVLNSSGNFVIYCLFGKTFRKIFLDTIHVGTPKGIASV